MTSKRKKVLIAYSFEPWPRITQGMTNHALYGRCNWILIAVLSLSAMACSKYYNVAELNAGETRSISITSNEIAYE